MALVTYGPFRGTMACPPTSRQRCIRHSRYPLRDIRARLTTWKKAYVGVLLPRNSLSMTEVCTCNVVFLPGQHDLGCAVVASGYVSGHLRVLDTSQAKVANLEIAIFINQNVAWFLKSQGAEHRSHLRSAQCRLDPVKSYAWGSNRLKISPASASLLDVMKFEKISYQVAMDDTCGMHVFETALLDGCGQTWIRNKNMIAQLVWPPSPWSQL
jgi:hypothetical protein